MPAILDTPVRARQRLSFPELRDEARNAITASGKTQAQVAGLIETTQSAVSEALNERREDRISNHAAVYQRIIDKLTAYSIHIERTVEIRVERKGKGADSEAGQ